VTLCLEGCETEYERMLRLSCSWNEDIKLVGCGRVPFAECVNHCEYCLGKIGSPYEGRSDECSQLKCAAYCAKREGEDCQKTYKILCLNAVEEIANAYNVTLGGVQNCDVQCGSTSKKAPGFLFILGLAVSLSSVSLPTLRMRHMMFALAAVFIASSLQGCEYDFCIHKATPSLSDWKVDFKKLDWAAGCHNDWNLMTGNPCASDVPVMWAKKGVSNNDEDYITENVENEDYTCLEWKTVGGVNQFCKRWIARESSCDEEDFGICTCQDSPSSSKRYCEVWTCFMLEASQRTCWVSCCGSENCAPCVQCGEYGSSPFPMNQQVFDELLQMSGTTAILTATGQDATNILRRAHYSHYYYGGQCIVSRTIKEGSQAPFGCSNWREIETEMSFCKCSAPDTSGDYCLRWTCEEKDVGQFSILFAKPMSYEGLIEGQEIEKYDCLEYSTASGISRCAKWKGDINSYEEVEVAQCIYCGNDVPLGNGLGECNTWICNEYELPRVHDVDDWPKRLFFSWVHFAWILPITCILCMPPEIEGGGSVLALYVCGSLCGSVFVAWLIWSIAFLRYLEDEARWVHPSDPFFGLLFPLLLGIPLAFATSLITKVPIPTGVYQVPIILLTGWFQTVGLYFGAPISSLVAVSFCIVIYMYARGQD